MKDMVRKRGLENEFHIESAATSREELGNPVYPPVRKILAEHGITCEGHAARQMTAADYNNFDLLIGMDSANLANMRKICGVDTEDKIHLLMDFTKKPGDVADPWYTRNFDETWNDINEGCEALIKKLLAQ